MAKDWLTAAIEARTGFSLGELDVTFEGDTAAVAVPAPDGEMFEVKPDPAAVREWARTDSRGRYRPLPGAVGIRRGWRVRCAVSELTAILDAVYPLAVRHIAQLADGTLRVESIEAVLGRQSGRYEPVRNMPHERRNVARNVLCGACVKAPLWAEQPVDSSPELIPCPEPCSVLVALCRDLAVLPELPEPVDPDPEIQFAAFEEPGNEIRERCLERLQREASPA